MKVFIKKLDGTKFEIEVNPQDTVADLKNNIETVLGYPAANQILVHQGQLLKDRTVLEEDNNVAENSVIVMLVSPTPRASVTSAPRIPPPPMTLSENEFGQAASHLIARINLDSRISEQGGLPASAGTMVVHRSAKPVQATQLPAVPPSVPNANPLNLFSLDLTTSAGAAINLDFYPNNLGFLRYERHFQTFREIVLAKPSTLEPMLHEVGRHNLQLRRLIDNYYLDFCLLLVEPIRDREHPFWQNASEVGPSRTLLHEDLSAIQYLQEIGFDFDPLIVLPAFFVCNKNETENFLLNLGRGFKDYYP